MNQLKNIPMWSRFFATIFGALIALVVLMIYVVTSVHMIRVVRCDGQGEGCTEFKIENITPEVINVQNLTYGLVSALVVAVLASTNPGEIPSGTQSYGVLPSKDSSIVSKLLTTVYIVAWIGIGVAMLFVGTLEYPKVSPTLHDMGITWIGVAVTAGFSYFGIKR